MGGAATNSNATGDLLTVVEVARRCRLSIRTIWRWSAAGRFPAPVRLGPQTTRWRSADIDAWLEGRAA